MTYRQRILIASVLVSLMALPMGCSSKATQKQSAEKPVEQTAPASAPETNTAPMTEPAEKGAKLADIMQPPGETLAMVDEKVATADSKYAIEFEPYGFGPAANGAKSYVIKVTSSKVTGSPKKPFDFKGRNVLVSLAPDSELQPEVGGSYVGTLTLKKRGELLSPELSKIELK